MGTLKLDRAGRHTLTVTPPTWKVIGLQTVKLIPEERHE